MKEVRYFYVPDAANIRELPADEATHAVRVLRLSEGDEMMLMDGQGTFYRAVVTVASNHHCMYDIQETLLQDRTWQGHIHLAIAPTKLVERMEWMIEKAVEIGVDEISFLNCKFSERQVVKVPRLEKIAVSAMKQSRKAWKTVLHEMQSFEDFIAGPEGDFSIDEVREAVSRGWKSVHLGTSRLRTETAGLSAVMMAQLTKQL